jgi:PEGA domain
MKTKTLTILAIVPLLFTGCASIIDGGPKTVQINSNPAGAKVTIFNKAGKEVSVNTTPATIALNRGGFYSTENYRFHFEMPGYYPYETHVKSSIDGWYFCNIIFGGALGILIVDPATGDMWTLSPREVDCNLVSSSTPLTPDELKAAELKANPVSEVKPVVSPKSKKN